MIDTPSITATVRAEESGLMVHELRATGQEARVMRSWTRRCTHVVAVLHKDGIVSAGSWHTSEQEAVEAAAEWVPRWRARVIPVTEAVAQ